MDVRLPDGTIIRGVPDDMTKDQLTAKLKANGYDLSKLEAPAQPQEATTASKVVQGLKDWGAGGLRGAGSIGATLLMPIDAAARAVGVQNDYIGRTDRRESMDQALQGVGANTESLPYQAGKIATEIAGTLPVGGILGKAVGAVAPRLGAAIASGGMTTGERVARGAVPVAQNVLTRMAGGAIAGGASAGLVNPEDAKMGALIGGALPPAAQLAGKAGRLVGSAVSGNIARGTATNKIAEALGDGGIQQAIGDIQTYYPKGAENIPVSSAAVVRNPELARLEQGSRLKSSPLWYEFDQAQSKAAFDNVMKATGEAEELGTRLGQRSENWREAWSKAADAQKPRVWARRMGQLGGDLQQAMQSPEASNPEVRKVIEAIYDEVVRVGPGFSPAHLQQLRANLNGKVQPMSPDVFKSAPRDNPAIKSLIAEMDDILNVSTGGKWQKVIEGYAKDSQSVHQAKAAAKVRGAFVDEATGRVQGTAANPEGDVAKVTEAGLGRALNAARLPDKSLALSAEANQRLEATQAALRRQNIVRGVKGSASAGGGSDTIPNAVAIGAQQAGAPNLLIQLLDGVRRMGTGKVDNQLAALLSNPDELARVLNGYLAPQAPNRLAVMVGRSAPVLAADR